MTATAPKTAFDKIWESHQIAQSDDGDSLLWIDRHYIHDDSMHAFDALKRAGRRVAEPGLTVATADHYVPTRGGMGGFGNPALRYMSTALESNCRSAGIVRYGLGNASQGIVHVVGPELGHTLPGMTIVCGDSHTSTHGALGTVAFGIGSSEVAHVLATQTLWNHKPKCLRVLLDGMLPRLVTSKDAALALLKTFGSSFGTGFAIEFSGPAVKNLSVEARMTLCNMAIEAGARSAIFPVDSVTLTYLNGRRHSPKGAMWERAVERWKSLQTDGAAVFDAELQFDLAGVAPMVSWGTNLNQSVDVGSTIPKQVDSETLAYMGLEPGRPLEGLPIDRAFIGSCTNGRIEDLRAAARVLEGRAVKVPTLIVPGSMTVKAQAEAEGLARVFLSAGCDWRDAGCSMCVAMNEQDVALRNERIASSTNRNFKGRQGQGARTHLMSPAMVAAAAVKGQITDVRQITEARAA